MGHGALNPEPSTLNPGPEVSLHFISSARLDIFLLHHNQQRVDNLLNAKGFQAQVQLLRRSAQPEEEVRGHQTVSLRWQPQSANPVDKL